MKIAISRKTGEIIRRHSWKTNVLGGQWCVDCHMIREKQRAGPLGGLAYIYYVNDNMITVRGLREEVPECKGHP